MRFGGHETFVVREGWLHKGLTCAVRDPAQLNGPLAQDVLGVGKNMAKSIRHWLLATGLVERHMGFTGPKNPAGLQPSTLGRVIADKDPYFLLPGTWWMLHINLINSPHHAYTWWWFFNQFRRNRFERAVCLESLLRFVQMNERRPPGLRTLQRDVACLLAMYARTYPPLPSDPEDGNDSPFVELGLLGHFRESGGYRRLAPEPIAIPAELLGYALCAATNWGSGRADFQEQRFRDCVVVPGGPARAFGLNAEQVYDLATRATTIIGENDLALISLAGDRRIRFRLKAAAEWAQQYYDRVLESELAA